MAKPSRRAPLNMDDPLSEPTAGRRALAAVGQRVPGVLHTSGKLKGSLNKKAVERELGVVYTSLDAWETGAVLVPDPQHLHRVHELTGYSIHDLQVGRAGAAGTIRIIPPGESRTAVLRDLKATHEERRAWGEHEVSPAGRHQDITRAYMTAWLERYRDARAQKRTHEKAMTLAWQAAAAAGAEEAALAEGRARLDEPKEG